MKKEYIKPTMEVVEIIGKPQILAGSGEVQVEDPSSEMEDMFFGGLDPFGLMIPM